MRRSGTSKREMPAAAAANLVTHMALTKGRINETDLLGSSSGREPEMRQALKTMGRAWNETGIVGQSSRYAALMGPPTWRERCVTLAERVPWLVLSRWLVSVTLPAAAVLLFGIWLFPQLSHCRGGAAPEMARDYSGGAAQQIALADGSVVDLLADTQLHVKLEAHQRLIQLAQGRARFSVAHDRSRPLIIQAGDTEVRVVGTKFELSYRDGCVLLTVLEGVVQVASGGETPRRLIAAEQTARSDDAAMEGGCLSQTMRTVARLSYRDAPLDVVIADANRFWGHTITIATPDLATEHVTTSFTLAQIDEMLASLSTALPLTVTRSAEGGAILSRRGSPSP